MPCDALLECIADAKLTHGNCTGLHSFARDFLHSLAHNIFFLPQIVIGDNNYCHYQEPCQLHRTAQFFTGTKFAIASSVPRGMAWTLHGFTELHILALCNARATSHHCTLWHTLFLCNHVHFFRANAIVCNIVNWHEKYCIKLHVVAHFFLCTPLHSNARRVSYLHRIARHIEHTLFLFFILIVLGPLFQIRC